MAEVEIKRGYEVLPDNNIRFGIRVTNTDGLVITDVEVTLYYPESLFSLEADRHQNLGNISPASTRTAEFLLKPLGCVHEENIEAHISYRDPKGHRHSEDMQPKEVHCVCPFLKGLKVQKAEFLELSGTGHSAETGLNFEGVSVERLTSFLVQTCKSRHYKVDELSIDGGRMLYLASESIGEKAYYLLTVLIKEDGGLTQVMLRAVSDKPHGLNGFLSETVADLRHVVETVQSAREIGVIRKEQVINIIDSVVQRTTFGWGDGAASVNIKDSVVQRTEFNAGEDRRVKEERLREEQEEQKRKEEQERLRRQEAQRAEQERTVQEHARREQEKQKAREGQEPIAKKKSKSRTNIFMLAIVLGALLVGFVMFAPSSDDVNDAQVPFSKPVVDPNIANSAPDSGFDASTPTSSSNQNSISAATAIDANYPQLTGFVTDNANMIDPVYEAKITELAKQIEQKTTVEIAVVTVESLEGESRDIYAVKLFNQAGIGKKDKDNGLLILVAKQEREYRFEVGYGLEGIIDDSMKVNIGDMIILPNFKNGDYGKGIYDSMVAIEKLL